MAYKAYVLGQQTVSHISHAFVYVIDTDTNSLVTSIDTGLIAVSTNLAVTSDGKKLYLIDPIELQVIDTASNAVNNTITSIMLPKNLAFSHDGSSVYVLSGWNSIFVLDKASSAIKSEIYAQSPHGMVFSPDGTKGYVVGGSSPTTIAILDVLTNSFTGVSIPFGKSGSYYGGPSTVFKAKNFLVITPDGATIYVANYNTRTVSVLKPLGNTITESANISVGSYPVSLALTPDGTKLYVANAGSILAHNGTVSVIDTASNTVTATIPLKTSLTDIAITPDGAKVYATGERPNSVFVIDIATNNVTTMYADGDLLSYGLIGIAMAPPPSINAQNCLFNWAETNYPGLFSPAGASTQTLNPYRYRYYKNTNSYLGVSSANNDVYYLGSNGVLQDVGPFSGWLTTSKCQ